MNRRLLRIPALALGLIAMVREARGETDVWAPRCWLWEAKPEQLRRAADGDDFTVCPVLLWKDLGLEAATAQRINRLRLCFVSLHGRYLQPDPNTAVIEVWREGRWQSVPADFDIDYSACRELAPFQGYGTVAWTCRFAPQETTRVRLTIKRGEEPLRWWHGNTFRGVLVREIAAEWADEASPAVKPSRRIVELARPAALSRPAVSPDGERLTDPLYHPSVAPISHGLELSWPRRRAVSMVRVRTAGGASAAPEKTEVQWWDGGGFRPVEDPQQEADVADERNVTVGFLPVATTRLRILDPTADLRDVEAYLCPHGQRYFAAAKDDAADLLGQRVLARGEPDWPRVAGLLLPIGFLKGFCGRPDDVEETMLTWDGKLIARVGDGPEVGHLMDGYLAFAINDRILGETPEELSRRLIDGWMPGAVYEVRRDGLSAKMTVFTTSPRDAFYGDRVHWEFERPLGNAKSIAIDVLFGLRTTMYAFYSKNAAGEADPSMFAPTKLDYRLADDGQTVTASDGAIVLWSSSPGQWAGTPWEPRLRIEVPLDGETPACVDFVAPHVGQRLTDRAPMAGASYEKSFAEFRGFWTEQLARCTQVSVPEPAVNDAMRNALCQCLIIPDSGVPFYGTYWYEWCIGVEEFWPTIALAQFGRAAEAQQHMAAMAARHIEETSHHFPYINSLPGAGAAEVALLTGDLAWCRGLLSELKGRAEWTIRSVANDNRGTPYAGLVRKFGYGGDVHAPAHSLYSNVTCWRGLRDTGLMLQELGDEETARRYLREAAALRERILTFWAARVDPSAKPPFVPYAFDIGYPDKRDSYAGSYCAVEQAYPSLNRVRLGSYWNLLMQILLELDFYAPGRPEPDWIRAYCEQHGGTTVGLTRYLDRVDWHYGAGYIKSLLRSGQREKFLLSFYGALAHGAADDARTSPEDCAIWPARTSNEACYAEYDAARWNWQSGWDEALSAAPGVLLQMIRSMLIDEGRGADGGDGSLRLLAGVPRQWLEDGKEIRVTGAATHFGPADLHVVSQTASGRIVVEFRCQTRREIREIVLRLFHPQRRPIRSAVVNGLPQAPANAETLRIKPAGVQRYRVVATF